MPDDATTLHELRRRMAEFVAERDWGRFHSPKNLVMGLAVEAAELMEHFLWMENAESFAVAQDAQRLTAIGEEMADVACYLLALANVLGMDLSDAIVDKLAKNATKYPVERYRGRYQ
ncbi:MAG: nucleotide pyrophosphohydrolase [Gemmatales bacterium]|nr:nucleotide pyrophosphohydrolase [Gemmatales bacterium]MDW8387436.1 nucleotide pyrophosphohydrolase [Gemmatales bacterium]